MYCQEKHNWNYNNWLVYYQVEARKSEYTQRSILKSTRQKNWLSIPGSNKHVTFQFEIPKATGEKQLVVIPVWKKNQSTMGKPQKESQSLPSNKRSDTTPFIYTPEEFPNDAAKETIETTENGSKLKIKMHVLMGDEVPEQLMIWLKNLEDKILKNTTLSSPAKLAIL